MAEKNVMLSIVAEQSVPGGDTNRMEMMTEGRLFHADGAFCLEYEESDSSGLGKSTTLMMVAGRMVSLIRRGYTTTHMVFSEGKKSYNMYRTPAGSMEMAILPTSMEIDVGEETGEITLEYELEIGGQYTGSNLISITYKANGRKAGHSGGKQ